MQKLVEQYFRDQEVSESGAESYQIQHVEEAISAMDDQSHVHSKKQAVREPEVKAPTKTNQKEPKTNNVPKKSFKKNNMPLKNEDKAIHPKAKKYREIMEKKKAKDQETTYQNSYIGPRQQEHDKKVQHKRSRTAENSRSKSRNMETEYRQDYADPTQQAYLKHQNKSVTKSKTRMTEYLQEFKGNSQTRIENPIEKNAKRHDKFWQDGQGETEYRKDYVNPKYATASKVDPRPQDNDIFPVIATTYRQEFNAPKKKSGQYEESTNVPIKVDTRTEYRSEFPHGKKGLHISKVERKHEEMKRSTSEDKSLIKERSTSKMKQSERPVRAKANKKVITYKKKKSSMTNNEANYESTPIFDTRQNTKVSNDIRTTEQKKIEKYFEDQQRKFAATRNLHESVPQEPEQKKFNQKRNLEESVEPELVHFGSERKPANLTRNLDKSKENPIDNWAYMSWRPSDNLVQPDPRDYKNNNIGMSYLVSKDNLGFSSSTDYLLRIADHDESKKYLEYKQEYERAKEAAKKTVRKIDPRAFQDKFAGLAGLPSNNHNKNQNYFIGEDEQNKKIDMRSRSSRPNHYEESESLINEISEPSNYNLEEGPTPMESEVDVKNCEDFMDNEDFVSER